MKVRVIRGGSHVGAHVGFRAGPSHHTSNRDWLVPMTRGANSGFRVVIKRRKQ